MKDVFIAFVLFVFLWCFAYGIFKDPKRPIGAIVFFCIMIVWSIISLFWK